MSPAEERKLRDKNAELERGIGLFRGALKGHEAAHERRRLQFHELFSALARLERTFGVDRGGGRPPSIDETPDVVTARLIRLDEEVKAWRRRNGNG